MTDAPTNDQLPSWNDGPTKRALLDFVSRVTREGSSDHVPPSDRIAVFDNDGTLWCEKPLPVLADFLMRRLGEMAARDPALRERQPWKAVVERDYAWLDDVIAKHYRGDDSELKLIGAGILQAYAETTIEAFASAVRSFMDKAQNPRLGRLYVRCVYEPMVELLRLLRANGFATYMVTGGGRDFMRVIAETCYGIPPQHVIGSSAALKLRDEGAYVTLAHTPELEVFGDGAQKPASIWGAIGRRPIFAGGNANGDIPMLRFCAAPDRPSLALLIDHDDAAREFAYQAGAEDALALARANAWPVASMKNDWKTVFAV